MYGIITPAAVPSINPQQLDIKFQRRIGGYARHGFRTIGQVSRDFYTALATDGHAGYTDIPALDHFAGTELEGERCALFVG